MYQITTKKTIQLPDDSLITKHTITNVGDNYIFIKTSDGSKGFISLKTKKIAGINPVMVGSGSLSEYGDLILSQQMLGISKILDNTGRQISDNYKGLRCILNNNKSDLYYRDGVKLAEDIDSFVSAHKKGNLLVYCSSVNNNNMYGLVDMKGHQIIKPICCDSLFIINDELIILDNHLLNINNIKEVYQLNIALSNCNITKTFDTAEQMNIYIRLFKEGLKDNLNNYLEEVENKSRQLIKKYKEYEYDNR